MVASERLKKNIRRSFRHLGVDFVRWRPQSSTGAGLAKMLAFHRIDTVLDVGANRGQYALSLREIGYRGRIISFEPLTETHQLLQISAAQDALWTVAPQMAIGDQEGEIKINIASNNGASSSVLQMLETHRAAAPEVAYNGSEVVPISRLDKVAGELLEGAQNILLKADVQGYELQVLKGSKELLRRVVGLQLELSFLPLYEGQALFSALIDHVSKEGFNIWGIIPGLADNSSGRLLQADVIFFR